MPLYTLYNSSQNFWEEFLQFLPNFWEEFLPKIFGMSFWEENGGRGNHVPQVKTRSLRREGPEVFEQKSRKSLFTYSE